MQTDLVIPQGTDWGVVWPVLDSDGQPADLGGWSGRAHWRTTVEAEQPIHTWSSQAGDLLLGDNAVTLVMSPADSLALPASTRGVYDVLLTDPQGAVWKIASGTMSLEPVVTR